MEAQRQFFYRSLQPLAKCQRKQNVSFTVPLWQRFLLLLEWLRVVTSQVLRSVRLDTLATLNAWAQVIRRTNRRTIVGFRMVAVGIVAIFLHRLLFSEGVRTDWYYTNNYYFYFTIRPYVVSVIWSIAFLLLSPNTRAFHLICFALWNAAGWAGVIHYSFFVDSNETFHLFPQWEVVASAIALGFSVVLSMNYHLYVENHKMRGNHTRFVGLAEMDLPAESKEQMYKSLAKEFRQFEKQY